ncbi:MAG: GNAT family N-acetyltransferase [Chloroflexi bacterium]|nr:GNAT family N-acetyltransferase [Chloroflexota bacterium]
MTCCSVSVSEETFDSISQDWLSVANVRSQTTVFDLLAWQEVWWQHFGNGKKKRIFAVRGDDGALEMLVPLMQDGGTVSFLGGTDLVDYHDVLCPSDPSEICTEAVIRELTADPGVKNLLFESIPSGARSLECLKSVLTATGWQVSVDKEDVAPFLDLPSDWEEYVSSLRKKDRHELRRKLRRLEASGDVRHIELTSREDIETAASDFFELHRKSTPDKEEFMTPEREQFFRDVAARLADDGITRLAFLEVEGKRVATSLSFVVDNVRYLYNSGYDPEYRQLAVGLLNHAYTIRNSIEQGHRIFDFMRGDESYKYHLGGVDRDVLRITATR